MIKLALLQMSIGNPAHYLGFLVRFIEEIKQPYSSNSIRSMLGDVWTAKTC